MKDTDIFLTGSLVLFIYYLVVYWKVWRDHRSILDIPEQITIINSFVWENVVLITHVMLPLLSLDAVLYTCKMNYLHNYQIIQIITSVYL